MPPSTGHHPWHISSKAVFTHAALQHMDSLTSSAAACMRSPAYGYWQVQTAGRMYEKHRHSNHSIVEPSWRYLDQAQTCTNKGVLQLGSGQVLLPLSASPLRPPIGRANEARNFCIQIESRSYFDAWAPGKFSRRFRWHRLYGLNNPERRHRPGLDFFNRQNDGPKSHL